MKFVVSLTSIFVRSAEEFYSFSVTSPVGGVFVPQTVNTSRNNWFFFNTGQICHKQVFAFLHNHVKALICPSV